MMKAELATRRAAAARRHERGAALITTLLVATLLFAAGAALIAATGMSGSVAGDATTEIQAYNAAEAGMQATMHVLRRNVPSNPAGTVATFRNVVNNPTLAPWLPYQTVNGQQMVVLNNLLGSGAGYSVRVIDPDSTPPAFDPNRLLVQVRGYGPRGSVKQTEMLVHLSPYDFNPPATVTIIGAEVGKSMHHKDVFTGDAVIDFDIGESSPKGYTGADQALALGPKAAFGFTVAEDKTIGDYTFANDPKALASTDDTPRAKLLVPATDLPAWLRTADAARRFLADTKLSAQETQTPGAPAEDRYFTSSPAKDNFGTDAGPLLTFVDGDCDFQGNGAGLLIVTGDMTFNGGAIYNGVVIMLGKGKLIRKGGGGGGIYGAIVMGVLDNNPGSKFLARPIIDSSGGGNSDIKFNSVNVTRAFSTLSPSVRDAREF